MMWNNGMGGGMGFLLLFWILLVVGAIVVGVVLVKVLTSRTGTTSGAVPPPVARSHRAREILEERYARGEISTEEYRERLSTLTEGDQ